MGIVVPTKRLPGGLSRANRDHMRAQNRAVVRNAVIEDGPMTRAEIARRTGLTRATVGLIVADLVSADEIVDTGLTAEIGAAGGRKGTLYQFNGQSFLGLVCHFGVAATELQVVDGLGAPLASTQVSSPHDDPEASIRLVVEATRTLLAQLSGAQDLRVDGVWAVVPGVIEASTGTVLTAPNLGWNRVDLVSALAGAFGCEVQVRGVVEAVAEVLSHPGGAADQGETLVVYEDNGIGAVMVSRPAGSLRPHLVPIEIGHFRLPGQTGPCSCGGIGCLETAASRKNLAQALEQGGLLEAAGHPYRIGQAAAVAQAQVGEGLDLLGLACSWLVNALRPDVVLFAGGFSDSDNAFRARVGDAIDRNTLACLRGRARVEVETQTHAANFLKEYALIMIGRRSLAVRSLW